MPRVIFDRLIPKPSDGHGQRPPSAAAWANLADVGDIVAIPRDGLAPHFDGVTHDNPAIVIGEHAFHTINHYLAARETAEVVAPLLNRYRRSDDRADAVQSGGTNITASS